MATANHRRDTHRLLERQKRSPQPHRQTHLQNRLRIQKHHQPANTDKARDHTANPGRPPSRTVTLRRHHRGCGGVAGRASMLRASASRSPDAGVAGAGVPAVEKPSPANQTTDGDEGGGQSDEELHAYASAFGTPPELTEVVQPRICSLYHPTAVRLDRCL